MGRWEENTIVNSEEMMDLSSIKVTSSPHLRTEATVSRIMFDVVIALMPATVAAVYFFGLGVLGILLSALVGALGAEALFNKIQGKPVTLYDGSAVVTGLLVALILPPDVPWWIPFLGGLFAIGVGKILFGGLGMNLFNPALVGRAFLVASFPIYLTTSN